MPWHLFPFRQKMEAEQEKKRAQEQANFLKTIKLKIVQGSGSVLVGGGGSGGGSQPRATASSKPAAPAAAKPMAPSSMFLSATKSPGEQHCNACWSLATFAGVLVCSRRKIWGMALRGGQGGEVFLCEASVSVPGVHAADMDHWACCVQAQF